MEDASSTASSLDLSGLNTALTNAGSGATTIAVVALGMVVAWRLACKMVNRGVGK